MMLVLLCGGSARGKVCWCWWVMQGLALMTQSASEKLTSAVSLASSLAGPSRHHPPLLRISYGRRWRWRRAVAALPNNTTDDGSSRPNYTRMLQAVNSTSYC